MASNKTVFFLIGVLLIVLGLSMLAPYSMQVIYKENNNPKWQYEHCVTF